MIPVPAVWNFNLSACWRRDIWNASLECFIAQAICFTNLKYCDDGLNGDYNLYMGGSKVSLLHQKSDISGLSGEAPRSHIYLPAGKHHRWLTFGKLLHAAEN